MAATSTDHELRTASYFKFSPSLVLDSGQSAEELLNGSENDGHRQQLVGISQLGGYHKAEQKRRKLASIPSVYSNGNGTIFQDATQMMEIQSTFSACL